MRAGLKKPAQRFSSNLHRHLPAADIERQARAKTTPKHHGVDHFGAPKPAAKPSAIPTISARVVSRGPVNTPSASAAAPLPSMITSASHQKLERLLDQALTHADAHKEALRYHAARHFWHRGWLNGRRRWAATAGIIIVLLAGLFLAWQKVPTLSVKMAGFRAHLSPTVPTYTPDGYRLAGAAQAVSGTVVIKYVSTTDGAQTYKIIQAKSDLNGSAVGRSVVPKGAAVQTSQVDGNTVYIYSGLNNAAWVNNGILYTVQDAAHLNSDELIKIVQGLNP